MPQDYGLGLASRLDIGANVEPQRFSDLMLLIPGYVSARWATHNPAIASRQFAFDDITVQLRNLGSDAMVIKFSETSNLDPAAASAGLRYHLLAVTLAPGAVREFTITARRQFLEIKGIEGTGQVRIDMVARTPLTRVAFEDAIERCTNPVWKADAPVLQTPVSQSFTSSSPWVILHNLGYIADYVLLNSSGVDITALATPSSITTNGFTATFGSAQAGRAISCRPTVNTLVGTET